MTGRVFHSAATVTLSLALAGAAFAQTPTPQPTPAPQPAPRADAHAAHDAAQHLRAMNGKTVTLTGCLLREQQVEGQTPNVAERADMAPDYILTNVQVRTTEPAGSGATGTPAAAAGAGGLKVKLVQVDNDQMRAHLNHQVEVTGRLEVGNDGRMDAPKKPAEKSAVEKATEAVIGDRNKLPALHVTAVKSTNQACSPAKQ